MPKCPICGEELEKPAPGGWKCKCSEFIPSEYAASHDEKCSCGTQHHH